MNKLLTIAAFLLCTLTASAQILYKVEGSNLNRPSYIFGTHHLAPTGFLDSIPGLQKAIGDADAIVGEVDMTGDMTAKALAMQPYMLAPQDSTLSRLFSPKRFTELNEKFEKLNVVPGINLYGLDLMKPMAVTNLVTIGLFTRSMPDYDPSKQLDTFIQQVGTSMGKDIIPLETAAEQANIIFNFQPVSVQAADLEEVLEQPEKVEAYAESMNEAYLRHDIETLRKLSYEENTTPEFRKALIDDRNRKWIRRLEEIFTSRPVFVAVGALHLPGEEGLISLLRREGYTVTALDDVLHQKR